MAEAAFDYRGDDTWREPILDALRSVVDPEAALSIVDMGLVLSVELNAEWVHVRLIMTSPACPVADVIVSDVEHALDAALPQGLQIRVEVCDDVMWTPARMSAEARSFMQW